MTELKEVRIGDSNIGLKDNKVTTNILPKSAAELERNISVQGNVIIDGAVYGNNIVVDSGPVQFSGAVFANNELHIKNDAQGLITFKKAVASASSVVALLVRGKALFGADINAQSVKLKNCFVAGSVFGTEVQLENTVVLGGVFASKKLTIHNCITGTFNAPEVNAGGINSLLYPTAFSVEPIALLPGTEFYNLSLADLGSLFKQETEKPHTGKILMDMTNDNQRTVLIDDAGAKILVNSYSVASRVLISDLIDFEKMENHFLIASASLGSQVLKNYSLLKTTGEKSADLTVGNIAQFFFDILVGKIQVQLIDGKITFDELKKQFD